MRLSFACPKLVGPFSPRPGESPNMRSSVLPAGSDSARIARRAPIYLNVYDLTNLNSYLYWFGLGVFHSGIEVHGVEYAYGAHDYPASGVFEVEPRSCPGYTFRRAIALGTTDKDPLEFRNFIDQVSRDYTGDSYHLIAKNCNHFTNDVCLKLTERSMPGWVNRLATVGAFCSCLLPEELQVSRLQYTTGCHLYEDREGTETREEQSDIYDQGQHLLMTSNGGMRSLIGDHHQDSTLKHMEDSK